MTTNVLFAGAGVVAAVLFAAGVALNIGGLVSFGFVLLIVIVAMAFFLGRANS